MDVLIPYFCNLKWIIWKISKTSHQYAAKDLSHVYRQSFQFLLSWIQMNMSLKNTNKYNDILLHTRCCTVAHLSWNVFAGSVRVGKTAGLVGDSINGRSDGFCCRMFVKTEISKKLVFFPTKLYICNSCAISGNILFTANLIFQKFHQIKLFFRE